MKVSTAQGLALMACLGLVALVTGCQNPSSSSSSTTTTNSRHLSLSGAYNTRDLGGYATSNNKTTKWGVYYRSDALNTITTADVSTLLASGIDSVVDFRGSTEYGATGGADVPATNASFTYVQYPIAVANPTATGANGVFTVADMQTLYHTILDSCAGQYAGLFHTLAAQGPGTLFHCTMGKDRAGIASALLLMAASVPDDVIVADYTLTEQYNGPAVAALVAKYMAAYGLSSDYVMSTMGLLLAQAPPAVMYDTLNYIRTNYGTVKAYLLTGASTTLTAETIAADYATVLANFVQ